MRGVKGEGARQQRAARSQLHRLPDHRLMAAVDPVKKTECNDSMFPFFRCIQKNASLPFPGRIYPSAGNN